MGQGDDASVDLAGQPAEARLYELAHLAAVILIAAEGIRDRIDDDELRSEITGLLEQFIEKRGGHAPSALESHEEDYFVEARQPSHVFQIGELAVVQSVDVELPAVQLVLVILAEHAERSDMGNRKPEPGLADHCGSHELLGQQAFAKPAIAVKPGDGEEGDPSRHQPRAFRYRFVLQRDRINVAQSRDDPPWLRFP
jgi:hypothetical protein